MEAERQKQEFITAFNYAKVGDFISTGVSKQQDERGVYISCTSELIRFFIERSFRNDADSRGWIMELDAYID